MSDIQKLSETKDHPLSSDDPIKKEWVKFEEEEIKVSQFLESRSLLIIAMWFRNNVNTMQWRRYY